MHVRGQRYLFLHTLLGTSATSQAAQAFMLTKDTVKVPRCFFDACDVP